MTETRQDILRRLRKAKDSERRLGRHLLEHDGPHRHFRPGSGIATTTGRVGHITALQFDVASRSYAAENKNMKVPAVLWNAWVQVVQVARREGLEPLLRIEPTNEQTSPATPNLIVITEARHAELLAAEKLANVPGEVTGTVRAYSKETQIGRRAKR